MKSCSATIQTKAVEQYFPGKLSLFVFLFCSGKNDFKNDYHISALVPMGDKGAFWNTESFW